METGPTFRSNIFSSQLVDLDLGDLDLVNIMATVDLQLKFDEKITAFDPSASEFLNYNSNLYG